jgi:hypothetical protein
MITDLLTAWENCLFAAYMFFDHWLMRVEEEGSLFVF